MNPQQHTPPPDNFAQIEPCTHLTELLKNRHDNFMSTYGQAVAVLLAMRPELAEMLEFEKDGASVGGKVARLRSGAGRCTTCARANGHVSMLCLQCPSATCYGRHLAGHARKHSHTFAVDCANGLLFCFACGNYINHAELNAVRLQALLRLLGLPLPPPDSDMVPHYTKPEGGAVAGLRGITNLGATCYMSCILQTLLHNPLVKHHFFNGDEHVFGCHAAPTYHNSHQLDRDSACITCAVTCIFDAVYTRASKEGLPITTLLHTAWYKNLLLAGFSEQDAHEFWQFLLAEFHADHEKIAGLAESCTCVTHTVFAGSLKSSVTCTQCHVTTSTIDPLVDISLEIDPNSPSLYACFDRFTLSELMHGVRCQLCRQSGSARKSLRLHKIPPVVCIQLKRFKHNQSTASKIETAVSSPLYLNLTKYASDFENGPEIDPTKVYELFAVVLHIGSVSSGHYVALIKTSLGVWFKFDDSVVSSVTAEEVQATNAYLLFYIAHNI